MPERNHMPEIPNIPRAKPEDVAATFSNFLEEIGHGQLNQVITERLHELVASCAESGEKGSITLTLTVEPEDKGRMAKIGAKLVTKKPEPKLMGGVFFAGSDGALHQEDPRQLSLPRGVHTIERD